MFTWLQNLSDKTRLTILFFWTILVVSFHTTTLTTYPACWFDEVEIQELGRFSLFSPFPNWSVNLALTADGTFVPPLPVFHYLAGGIQEFLFQTTNSFAASRLFFLSGLCAATLFLFLWLRDRKIDPTAAFLSALLFSVCPNVTICAHWYRPDIWATAIALGALLLFSRKTKSSYMLGGFLLVFNAFFWITSLLFLPLAALLFFKKQGNPFTPGNQNHWFSAAGWIFLGAALALLLFLLPLYKWIPEILRHYFTHSELSGNQTSFQFADLTVRAKDFLLIALRSPFVWLFAAFSVLRPKRFLPEAFLLAILIGLLLATRVYHLRMIYLLPLVFLFFAHLPETFSNAIIRNKIIPSAYLLSFLLYTALSVGCINFGANTGEPHFPELCASYQQVVPTPTNRPPRVFLYDQEHELYFFGRTLHWDLFSLSPRERLFSVAPQTLASLDAILFTVPGAPTLNQTKILQEAGFQETAVIPNKVPPSTEFKGRIASAIYAHGYPECRVWRKTGGEP